MDLSHLVAETGMDPSMAIRKLKTCGFGSGSPTSAPVLSLNQSVYYTDKPTLPPPVVFAPN